MLIGVASSLGMNSQTWIDVSSTLVSVVSIVAAGVLVRLARGVPFAAVDALSADEARRLAIAIRLSVRALRALLFVCALVIALFVFLQPISSFVYGPLHLDVWGTRLLVCPLSFLCGCALSFVGIRAIAVVNGDVEITDIQAKLLIKKRGKEKAEAFESSPAAAAAQKFKMPAGYGGEISRP